MARILLVEDDNNLRDIYGERLMAEGYEIISASDGEEALQLASQQKPDLIISDVMMPKISGFDMLDILRQTPDTKNIKIIMMTALSQAEDKSRADKLGADKYLVKSQVTLEDVARVVHDILGDTPPDEADETDQNASFASNLSQPSDTIESSVPIIDSPNTSQTVPSQNSTTDTLGPVNGTPPAPLAVPEPIINSPVASLSTNDPSQTSNGLGSLVGITPQVNTSPLQPVQSTVINDTSASPVPSPSADPSQLSAPSVSTPPITISNPIISDNTTPPLLSTDINPANAPGSATPLGTASNQPIVQASTTAPLPSVPDNNSSSSTTKDETITNPITGEASSPVSYNQAQVNSDATSTEQEISEVAKQIENFMASNNPVASHTEPLKEPSEQDLIHAQNSNEDPKVVTASVAPNAINTASLNPSERVAPPIEVAPNIPPIIKPQLDTANPEPVSNRKRIIQPINDTALPDIHKLYEQQMAKEAEAVSGPAFTQAPAVAPIATNTISKQPADDLNNSPSFKEEQVFNPIITNTDPPAEVEPPELEQVDITSIAGANEPTEDTNFSIPAQLQTSPVAPTYQESTQSLTSEPPSNPPANPVVSNNSINSPTAPLPSSPATNPNESNPNDPSNFAL